MVVKLVTVHDLKGKEVYAKRGIKIGEVEDVELDDNWQVKALDVKMNENVAKALGEKAGFMERKVVPLPANMLGPIADKVTLTEEVKDFDSIRNTIRTEKPW